MYRLILAAKRFRGDVLKLRVAGDRNLLLDLRLKWTALGAAHSFSDWHVILFYEID